MTENLYDPPVEKARNATVDGIMRERLVYEIKQHESRDPDFDPNDMAKMRHSILPEQVAKRRAEWNARRAELLELTTGELLRRLRDLEDADRLERERREALGMPDDGRDRKNAFDAFLGADTDTPESRRITDEMYSLRYPHSSRILLAQAWVRASADGLDDELDAIAEEENDLMFLLEHHIFQWDMTGPQWDAMTGREGFGKAMGLGDGRAVSDHIFNFENADLPPLPYDNYLERAYKLLRAVGITAARYNGLVGAYLDGGGAVGVPEDE